MNGICTKEEFLLVYETHKIHKKFEIQKDHSILARRSNLVLIKRTCHLLKSHRVKIKESKKIDEYLDLARNLKKLWNMNVSDTNNSWCTCNSLQWLDKKTGEI